MKDANFLFIILIIAAAVITGSTVAMANNFDFIFAQLNTAPSASQATENTPPPANTKTIDAELPNINAPIVETNQPGIDENNVTFTPHEQRQVLEMLYALGMIKETNYEEFVKNFQTEHNLNPTGELDSKTLTLIIKQSKQEKANNSVDTN